MVEEAREEFAAKRVQGRDVTAELHPLSLLHHTEEIVTSATPRQKP